MFDTGAAVVILYFKHLSDLFLQKHSKESKFVDKWTFELSTVLTVAVQGVITQLNVFAFGCGK